MLSLRELASRPLEANARYAANSRRAREEVRLAALDAARLFGDPAGVGVRGRVGVRLNEIGGSSLREQPAPPHTYDELLRLDERNVCRGIDEQTQERYVFSKPLPSDVRGQTCSICLEDFPLQPLRGDVVSLPCRHHFHRRCVSRWLLKERTCPTCRFEVHPRATAA